MPVVTSGSNNPNTVVAASQPVRYFLNNSQLFQSMRQSAAPNSSQVQYVAMQRQNIAQLSNILGSSHIVVQKVAQPQQAIVTPRPAQSPASSDEDSQSATAQVSDANNQSSTANTSSRVTSSAGERPEVVSLASDSNDSSDANARLDDSRQTESATEAMTEPDSLSQLSQPTWLLCLKSGSNLLRQELDKVLKNVNSIVVEPKSKSMFEEKKKEIVTLRDEVVAKFSNLESLHEQFQKLKVEIAEMSRSDTTNQSASPIKATAEATTETATPNEPFTKRRTSNGNKVYRCNYADCNEMFLRSKDAMEHAKQAHSYGVANHDPALKETSAATSTCTPLKVREACPYDGCSQTFDSSEKLEVHKREHEFARDCRCKTCKKHFQAVGDLMEHEKVCQAIIPCRWKGCTKQFRLDEMDRHVATHMHSQPKYVCDYKTNGKACAAVFASSSQFAQHRVMHLKETASKAKETEHERVQSSVKCPYCTRLFPSDKTLRKHVETAHKKFIDASIKLSSMNKNQVEATAQATPASIQQVASSEGAPPPKKAKTTSILVAGEDEGRFVTCAVCHVSSWMVKDVTHWGVRSCEFCYQFVRKWIKSPRKYFCLNKNLNCVPDNEYPAERTRCKACIVHRARKVYKFTSLQKRLLKQSWLEYHPRRSPEVTQPPTTSTQMCSDSNDPWQRLSKSQASKGQLQQLRKQVVVAVPLMSESDMKKWRARADALFGQPK